MTTESFSLSHIDKITSRFKWIIPIVAILLYANTIGHDFTQDDRVVITSNIYTKKGVSGISDILSYDTFFGAYQDEAQNKIVSGGRYRPLTLVMFAIEYQVFGQNPFIGHLFNIVLYALLCFFIYLTLAKLFDHFDQGANLAFIAAMIYTIHPLHTEVVANSKSRDEIMAMLFSVLTLWYLIKFVEHNRAMHLIIALGLFFLGLMSKENTITFIAIIPLALVLFKKVSVGSAIRIAAYTLLPVAIFLFIRAWAIGSDFGALPTELLNNPFLKWNGSKYIPYSFMEKMASILYSSLIYLKLLIFPHPLTHDYYPYVIPEVDFTNILVIISLAIHIALLAYGVINVSRNKVLAFGILFYFITFSIVSNVFFPIGTNMAERFMFMPSLGFSLALAFLLIKLGQKNNKLLLICSVLLFAGFSIKTIARNMVWKDDYTISTTDLEVSRLSAKIYTSLAEVSIKKAQKLLNDPNPKYVLYNQALEYALKGIEIHPLSANAILLKGNSLFFLKRYDEAIQAYDEAIVLFPDFMDARNNKSVAFRDKGIELAEQKRDVLGAYNAFLKSYELNQNDDITLRYLSIAEGVQGKHQEAIKYLRAYLSLKPNDPMAFLNMGKSFQALGIIDSAQYYIGKAQTLNPNIMSGN